MQNVPGAAFTHMNGKRNSIDISPDNLFPYLLVNIGSGVSILKVALLHPHDTHMEIQQNAAHITMCYQV
jgi:pantothenate kinase